MPSRKTRLTGRRSPKNLQLETVFPFQVFSVDASETWIATAKERIPKSMDSRIHLQHSDVRIGTFQERMCHFYDNLPDIVPDFIYLDGPAPKDVQGSINGMSFQCDERTVMSGDLLLMEPILLPGTLILVDGRTNNARFLQRNFQRSWKMTYDREGDVTTFELVEDRLGPYNIIGARLSFLNQLRADRSPIATACTAPVIRSSSAKVWRAGTGVGARRDCASSGWSIGPAYWIVTVAWAYWLDRLRSPKLF